MTELPFAILNRADTAELPIEEYGHKAHFLSKLHRLSLPCPPGIAFPIDSSKHFSSEELGVAIRALEAITGKVFGSESEPLIVAVRSSPVNSTPGVIGACLNIGLTKPIVERLDGMGSSTRFLYDSYAKLLEQIGSFHGLQDHLDYELSCVLHESGINQRPRLSEIHFRDLTKRYEAVFASSLASLPADPINQLSSTIESVISSWESPQAHEYRSATNDESPGIGIVLQQMVFGNLNENSCTGVGFSRSPSDGSKAIFGEFLVEGQGADWLIGNSRPIEELASTFNEETLQELETHCRACERASEHVQDFEFTIESGTLHLLQTRNGRCTPEAIVRINCDLVREGVITETTAASRVTDDHIDELLLPRLDLDSLDTGLVLCQATPGAPGAGAGELVLDLETAKNAALSQRQFIYVLPDAFEEDEEVLNAATGVVVTANGLLSNASIICRQLRIPCVVNATQVDVDPNLAVMHVGECSVGSGAAITIDGHNGLIIFGNAEISRTFPEGDLAQLLEWKRRLG